VLKAAMFAFLLAVLVMESTSASPVDLIDLLDTFPPHNFRNHEGESVTESVYSKYKMCSNATANTARVSTCVQTACDVADAIENEWRSYGVVADAVRRQNYVAMVQANTTNADITNMTVHLDWSHRSRSEYSYANHKADYDAMKVGKGCAVKCDIAKHYTPQPGWAHVTDGRGERGFDGLPRNQDMGRPLVRMARSLECCSTRTNAEFGLVVGFSKHFDTYTSYYSKSYASKFTDTSAPPPLKDAYSAIFVSTFCEDAKCPNTTGQPLLDQGYHYHGTIRQPWLRAIMDMIPIKSYGNCFHTRGADCPRGSCSKVKTASKYPFHLAFENTFAPGYTTEKFYQALALPSIPVVMSAPDVEDMAPTKDAYINVADFSSPTELVAYMKTVISNETLRNSFTAWKKNTTLVKEWTDRLAGRQAADAGPFLGCEVCKAYVRKWGCNLLTPIPKNCPKPAANGGHPTNMPT